jgi:hypothetical protein
VSLSIIDGSSDGPVNLLISDGSSDGPASIDGSSDDPVNLLMIDDSCGCMRSVADWVKLSTNEGAEGVNIVPINAGTEAVATAVIDVSTLPFVSINVIPVRNTNISPVKPYVATGTPSKVNISAILYII